MPISLIPYVPQYIRVHLAPAGQDAETVTVSFPDYIKNVASSEVYPTWSDAALRANILAQISFALNRVNTEYYPSRGYDFDITNSTINDQKFIKGRSTFENIDRLVDELFTTYIRRVGFVEPLSARFCNGTTVTCDGLSQWGSEELAQQGYGVMDILRHYYGDNIELVTDAPIRNLTSSYPGFALRSGVSGDYIVLLQNMLNRVAQNYPAIPRINPVDGIFGTQTEEAVKKFQSIFNLTPDGVVGRATWYKLVFLYVGIARLSELISEGQPYTQVQAPSISVILQAGSQGLAVSALQYFLAILSQFSYGIPAPAIDGIFGPQTEQAVLAAQRALGLEPTGVVNRNTWLRIFDEYTGIASTALAEANLPTDPNAIENAVLSQQFPGIDLSYNG